MAPVAKRSPKYAPIRILAAAGLGILLAVAAAQPAPAAEWRSWCGEGLGWHFYCDRPEETRETPPAPTPPSGSSARPAMERILEMRRQLEEARASAILDPSPAKVAAYLRLQQETLQRAASFSDAFRRTVWATPELDYTLKRPVGALGQAALVGRAPGGCGGGAGEARRALRAHLSRPHAKCAGCKVFGPLLRAFATAPRPRRAGGVVDRRAPGRLARGRA